MTTTHETLAQLLRNEDEAALELAMQVSYRAENNLPLDCELTRKRVADYAAARDARQAGSTYTASNTTATTAASTLDTLPVDPASLIDTDCCQ